MKRIKLLQLGTPLLCLALHAAGEVRYVDVSNPNPPTAPFTSWSSAALTIQDAIDVSVAGDEIVVTNGVYQTGGRLVSGVTTTNRVVVNRAVTVRSVNGPAVTVIQGQKATGGGNGVNAIRCAWLTNGAVLIGFTLTNGATTTTGSGGGLYCLSFSSLASNCVLTGNSADKGGGAYSGSLKNCALMSNSASSYGGGANSGRLTNCTLFGNSATQGGGAYDGYVGNCLLASNTAAFGGGAYSGSVVGSTFVGNYASNTAGGWSGVGATFIFNSILYYNSAPNYSNFFNGTAGFLGCCTTPLPNASSFCITNEPLFVDLANGNLRLASNSPCINAGGGTTPPVPVDLDGNPRVVAGWIDLGAYECQSPALLDFYLWLQSYGLSPWPEKIYIDSDFDGANNWQEWIAGTIPTNALSVLRMVGATLSDTGTTVTWQSVIGATYFLERSTNLTDMPSFWLVATNLTGQVGTTSHTDTDGAGLSPAFYRVGVQSYVAPRTVRRIAIYEGVPFSSKEVCSRPFH